MANTKRMVTDALFAAIALLLFMVEAQIPPVVPIPGIKLGLANIMTLTALHIFGKRDAAAVLSVRIIIGAVLAGKASTFVFSSAGAILCFLTLCLLHRFFTVPIWVQSVFGAIAHNTGQLLVAAVWMHTKSVFWYLPFLLLAAILSGCFTGLSAQYFIRFLQKKGVSIS